MKTKNLLVALAFGALAAGLVGCEKKSESGTPPTTNAAATIGDSLKDAADAAATEVKKVAEEVKNTAEKTATDVTHQAQSLAADATVKAQEYIDKAKAFFSQQKYQDALTALKELGNLSLSPEQQKAVSDLKLAIQNALGTPATTNGINAAQGLLKR